MTLNDLEWPFHASRAISAVAELFVYLVKPESEKSLFVLHFDLEKIGEGYSVDIGRKGSCYEAKPRQYSFSQTE